MRRILYQFPVSHYCEKARWLLDFKHLDYEVRNLLPGAHRLLTQWAAHSGSVPVLRDGKHWVADSTEMAFHLDAAYPEYPLLPRDPLLRSRAAMLEEIADEAGEHVRRWLYFQCIDQDGIRDAMLDSFVWAAPYKELMWAGFKRTIFGVYRINERTAAESLDSLMEGIGQLEQALVANGGRYLVGDGLTLADIAAAALYTPLLDVPETPWAGVTRGPLFQQVFDDINGRPFGQWVRRVYREERNARGNWQGKAWPF